MNGYSIRRYDGNTWLDLQVLAVEDHLLRMKVSSQTRKGNPNLPTHWDVREVSYEVKGKLKTVLTSLAAATYSAKAIAKLYQEHWEVELSFRDIKSSLQQNAMTLLSKARELVYQKVWGLLLTYNVTRREASQAAVAFGRSPWANQCPNASPCN